MEPESRELICIGCPMGCRLQVVVEQGKVRTVRGNACSRGRSYAHDEVLAPRRMVTSLIAVAGSRVPLSVRTSTPVPKDLIFPCLKAIQQCKVTLPVRTGDVILPNVLDTGVDIIATRDLPDQPCQAGDSAP